ncbi:MAG: CHAT domain-containing protein [Saprospiraceae bacterium]|nr:CHAT domain-containing protein [Saprospiraceae bacterium]
MKKNPPILFFSFANDQDQYLAMLKQESTQIYDSLEDLKIKGFISIHREESADIDKIFDRFSKYKEDIAIFHYGGHANGTHLKLEGDAGHAEGLAQLMGQQPNLKLVFLNGCASKGQVQCLFDAGVPAVIATSVKVQDSWALNFARYFYKGLSNGRTIGQAFRHAQAYLKTIPGSISANYLYELPAWGKPVDSIPWGLYMNPNAKDDITYWRLPYYKPVSFSQDLIQYIRESFPSNRYIVQYVLEEMCNDNPDILNDMYEAKAGERVKKDSSQYPWILIENFPWPIGAQILKLFQFRGPTLERLEHLVSTYVLTSQVLYYIILSDLWMKCREEKMPIPWASIDMDKSTYLEFDFLQQVKPLYEQVLKKGTPFVDEYEKIVGDLTEQGSLLQKSHLHLESLKKTLLTQTPQRDVDTLCLQAEQALVHILKAATFLSRYRMLTVRQVGIFRPRFAAPEYELDMGPLNASHDSSLSLYRDADRRKKPTISDSTSIVLVPSEDSMEHSLNLSPFIMDKNTFAQVKKSESTDQDKIPHVFVMGWKEDGELHYLDVKHSIFTAAKKVSDQVHTGMTLDDFVEGRTIPEVEPNDFGLDMDPVQPADSPKVFQLLKDQYDQLVADQKI